MATGVQTWLSPFAAVWRSAYPSAEIPFKQLAQALSPLRKAHDPERIAAELKGYLSKTPPQFLNLRKFAATFGSWARLEPKARGPYYQSVDDMDRNAGIIP
jgi:hypothetical protein